MTSLLLLLVCACAPLLCEGQFGGQEASMEGYRLPNNFQYLALAPKLVRADMTYNVYVTLYSLPYPSLRVRAVLSNDGVEYASNVNTFTAVGTKNIQLRVPLSVKEGNHRLLVEGLILDGAGQAVFSNETRVYFQSKYAPIFVVVDHAIYYPEQTVNFRIVGTTQNLQALNGVLNVYMRDANGIVVMRWLQKQLNLGVYEGSYDIPYPVNVGNWTVEVEAFGHTYHQQFSVRWFWQRLFDVIFITPPYVFDTEWGIAGTLEGEHLSSAFIEGNAEITARIRNLDGTFMPGEIRKIYPSVLTVISFEFTMQELTQKFGNIAGKDVFLKAWLTDWFWLDTKNGTAVIHVVEDGIRVKALGKRFQSFKPNTPFYANMIVERTDGTPYSSEHNRQIVVQRVHYADSGGTYAPAEEKIVIPDDSVINYQVMPRPNDRRIVVTAWHSVTQQKVEIDYYRYWSERDNYLAITTSTGQPSVDEYMVFTIRMNFFIDEVNYLVMAKGNLLFGSTLTMKSLQRTFSLAVSRDMAPAARIVVYCMKDGEILTDSLNFYVKDTRLLNARLLVNAGKDFRGDMMELIGYGPPGGFLYVGGINGDFYFKGGNTLLNEEKVTRELLSFNAGDRDNIDAPQHHVWYYEDERFEGSVFFNQPTTGIDHITTFNASGLVILTDLNITVPEELSRCNSTQGFGRCLNGDCYTLNNTCNGIVDCTFDGYDEMGCEAPGIPPQRPDQMKDLHLFGSHFTEIDWMYTSEYVKFTGQTEIMYEVPDADCEFAIGGFIMHPTEGLSVVNEPVLYDTTRLFTMNVEATEVLKRGEQLGLRCTVFNFWDQELEIIVMLHGSDDYRFVAVEDMGIVRSYAPRTIAGDIQTMVELPAGDWRYVNFPIVSTIESGEINVMVSAYSILRVDVEEVTIEVIYDAIGSGDDTPYLVDLVNSGSVIIPDFDIPTPERFFIPGQRELLYIPGSNGAVMNIWGDMAWPGFFEDHLSSDATIGNPHDQADGYMFDFSVNLLTLQFLQGASALDPDQADTALEYMQSILARQYAYMQEDGSFKMFRRSTEPSLWLTSFILRCLHEAHASEWEPQLYIESETLNRIAMWIVNQFNETSQRFEETGDHYYDRYYRPYTTDPEGVEHEWHIPVTAQVVITLAETTRLTGEANSAVEQVKRLAVEYLSTKVTAITDPLQMAMVAFAMNRANHRDADEAYQKLKGMARKGEFVYWSAVEIPGNLETIVNNRILMGVRDKYEFNGHAIRATAYALMLYLDHDEFEASMPIMHWLHTQHNALVGWDTTSDTLLVMKALTQFALRQTNRDIYQMRITITATKPTDPPWQHVLYLNKSNFAELHTFELEEAWGQIRAEAQGTGYAYMHMQAEYHIEHNFLVDNPDYDAFAFEIERMQFHGRNASHLDMTLCLSWVRTDIAPQAGMTYMNFYLPTGYVVDRDIIQQMYLQGVPGLKRVRFRDATMIVFFEYVTTERTCFSASASRWYPVANMSIPNLIEIWEYAETRLQSNYMYEVYTLFHNHICQVCGSFQCPYCPFYNSAPPYLPPSVTLIFSVVVVLLAAMGDWNRLLR